ncbi:MAG: hypothetical protein RMK52_02705 [Chitinophagales bacterium]|nr:hypothetical protein [Chitinophagales bacterium]MDW8393133.1 hypothetical protein [Chitinophagales bacterium]
MRRIVLHPLVLFSAAGSVGVIIGLITGSFFPWLFLGIGIGLLAAGLRRLVHR